MALRQWLIFSSMTFDTTVWPIKKRILFAWLPCHPTSITVSVIFVFTSLQYTGAVNTRVLIHEYTLFMHIRTQVYVSAKYSSIYSNVISESGSSIFVTRMMNILEYVFVPTSILHWKRCDCLPNARKTCSKSTSRCCIEPWPLQVIAIPSNLLQRSRLENLLLRTAMRSGKPRLCLQKKV